MEERVKHKGLKAIDQDNRLSISQQLLTITCQTTEKLEINRQRQVRYRTV